MNAFYKQRFYIIVHLKHKHMTAGVGEIPIIGLHMQTTQS